MIQSFVDLTDPGNRAQFESVQVNMAAAWYQRLVSSGVDVESYIKKRQDAYLFRWREALAFLPSPSRILDIGGGYGFPALFEHITARAHDYWYLDIDAGAAQATAAIGAVFGVPTSHFRQGSNEVIPHDDASFDGVFSSHCVEHSADLNATFAEIRRVLKPDGILTFAVPIGWDFAPEHQYALGVEDWLHITEIAGFDVMSYHIGNLYPESGSDLFIAARRQSRPAIAFDVAPFKKSKYLFIPHTDNRWRFDGPTKRCDDRIILAGPSSSAIWRAPEDLSRLVIARHDWSGRAKIVSSNGEAIHDLYSYYTCTDIVSSPEDAKACAVCPTAGHRWAKGCEVVIFGGLINR